MKKASKEERALMAKLQLDNLKELGFFDDLLQHIADDEYDREVLPHFGMIPDFYIRWRDLKDKVKDLLL